jgi:hypothetical protein
VHSTLKSRFSGVNCPDGGCAVDPKATSPHARIFHHFFSSASLLISSISPPKFAQTIRPSATHSLSSLISAKLRTRTLAPGTPKISPSAPWHSPLYKVDGSQPSRKEQSLPAHKALPASSCRPLRQLGSSPFPSSTPPGIRASCIDTHSGPTEMSFADDPRDNESSTAHKTNSCAATWTTPAPIIVPQKSARRSTATLPVHLANHSAESAHMECGAPAPLLTKPTNPHIPPATATLSLIRSLRRQLSTFNHRLQTHFKPPPPPHTALPAPSIPQPSPPSESHPAPPPPYNSAPPPRTQNPAAAAFPIPASAHK